MEPSLRSKVMPLPPRDTHPRAICEVSNIWSSSKALRQTQAVCPETSGGKTAKSGCPNSVDTGAVQQKTVAGWRGLLLVLVE